MGCYCLLFYLVFSAKTEMSEEIENSLAEMEACFKLLLPSLSEFTFSDEGSQCNQDSPDKTANGSSTISRQRVDHQWASNHIDDEQPCSSKDLSPQPLANTAPEEQQLDEELDNFSQNEDDESENFEDNEEMIRNYGLLSHKYSLDLEINTGKYRTPFIALLIMKLIWHPSRNSDCLACGSLICVNCELCI